MSRLPTSLIAVLVCGWLCTGCAAPAPVPTGDDVAPPAPDSRAGRWIEALGLQHLALESGWFTVTHVSAEQVVAADGPSPVSNAIYFMLTRDRPINYVHRMVADDIQTLIDGGPADYYLFHPDGSVERITMGRDTAAGQQPMVVQPAHTAKAIVLRPGADFLLVGSVVTPAWNPDRIVIGGDQTFLDTYVGKAPWATEAFLRRLIGPNFGAADADQGGPARFGLDAAGNFLYHGKQLTLVQMQAQLVRIARAHPGRAVRLDADPASSEAHRRAFEAAVRSAGLTLAPSASEDAP